MAPPKYVNFKWTNFDDPHRGFLFIQTESQTADPNPIAFLQKYKFKKELALLNTHIEQGQRLNLTVPLF